MTTNEAEVLWTPKMKGRKRNYLENNETQLNNRSSKLDVRMERNTGMQDLVYPQQRRSTEDKQVLRVYVTMVQVV